ncbi:MAG: gamma-glutamyltransferase, partial [Pseudomonadota bacterium]
MPSQRRLPRLASRFLALLLAPVLALPLIWSTPASSQTQAAPELATGFTPKPLVESESAMIVAAHPLASAAGAEILEDGGAAVDAAIAAQLVLNVVEPQSSGIGGGAFALTYSAANAQLVSWDGRETAPAAAREDMFLGPDGVPLGFLDAVASGLSVGVPTLIRMMEAMHERHGVLPWARLFEPAIRHASDGFTVTPRLAASITRYEERLRTDRAAARLFFDENGMPLRAGATMANPALAETLRAVAAEGAEAFYTGSVAEAIVAAVAAGPRGGAMTLDDLAGAAAVSRPAVCALYRVYFQV